MSSLKNSSTPVLGQVFSQITPVAVREEKIKDPNDIAEELIQKHFLQGDYSSMLPREKQAIKNCILEAFSKGAIQTLLASAKDLHSRAIAEDAVAFEATLEPWENKTRYATAGYPWGWAYVNQELQNRFREFCNNNPRKK